MRRTGFSQEAANTAIISNYSSWVRNMPEDAGMPDMP